MQITIIDDEKPIIDLLEAIIKHTNPEIEIESYFDYNFVPNGSGLYFLDYSNPFGINGDEWLDKYKDIVIPDKRVLVSGIADNWQHYEGTKIGKPFSVRQIQAILTQSQR